MKNKKTLIILLVIAVITVPLFSVGWLRIQIGSSQSVAEKTVLFSGELRNVTGELLMTPGGDTLEKRQEEIEQTRSLDFWLYGFTYEPLLDAFRGLARAGVSIRGIVENKPYSSDMKGFDKLVNHFTGRYFAAIQSDEKLNDNFMHAKTFLTDRSFIIQTANLSYSSFFGNREFFFVSYDTGIRANLKHIFEKDRKGESLHSSDIEPNVLVCPIDCRSKIETLLAKAKTNIRMYQQYIQDEHIMSMLMERSGLDLKFIVADNDSKEQLVASPLSGFAHFRKKPYVHAKMILIDDTYLILSSINMSVNSMDKNREIGIILIDSFLIKQFKEQFERDRRK